MQDLLLGGGMAVQSLKLRHNPMTVYCLSCPPMQCQLEA